MTFRTVLVLTWPYVAGVLRSRAWSIAALAGLGLLVGVVATIKSLLESAMINQASTAIGAGDADLFWAGPFDSWPRANNATDWGEHVLASLQGVEVTIATVALLYVASMVLSTGLAALAVAIREGMEVHLFRNLFGDGLRAFMDTGGVEDGPNEPGGVTGAVQQGAGAVSGAWAVGITSVQQVTTLVSVIVLVGAVHPLFAAAFLGITLCLGGVSQFQAWHLAKQREKFDDERKDLLARTDDVLSYRDVLLAHDKDTDYIDRLEAASARLARINKSLAIRESLFGSLQGLVYDVGRLFVVGLVVVAVAVGTDVTAVGDIYFFISIYARLLIPVMGMLAGYDRVRQSASTSNYLLRLLAQWTTQRRGAQRAGPAVEGSDPVVRVNGLHYGYADESRAPVLSNCSFVIPRGGTTLLIGRSGSGKTTIARLILGFLEPRQGTVEVFGMKNAGLNRDALARMSYLAQARHFVEGTVDDNLFAADTVSAEERANVLQQVGLVASPADGADMLQLEARGLSEGQKQRLALARILVDHSELVILDEPLSGVDALTLSEIDGPLQDWLAAPERTVLVISHRLEFALFARHVLVLDGGSVIEAGHPNHLKADPASRFKKMWDADRRFS